MQSCCSVWYQGYVSMRSVRLRMWALMSPGHQVDTRTHTANSQHSHTRPYPYCTLPYMCLHTVMCDRVRTGTQQHRPTHLLTLRGTRLTCHRNDLASRFTPSALPRGPNILCIVKCISPENTRGVLTSIPFVVYVTFIIVLYYHGIAAMLYDYEPKTQTHSRACLLQWRGMLA